MKKRQPKFDTLIIGIKTDRETLYSKIDARIDQMIKDGLVEEVRKLVDKYGMFKESFNTIGYKEIIDYFNKKQTARICSSYWNRFGRWQAMPYYNG